MQSYNLVGGELCPPRHVIEIGRVFGRVAGRQPEQTPGPCRRATLQEKIGERGGEPGTIGHQRVVVDEKRPEGGDRLDDAGQAYLIDQGGKRDDPLIQGAIDTAPEFDDQCCVACRQKTRRFGLAARHPQVPRIVSL